VIILTDDRALRVTREKNSPRSGVRMGGASDNRMVSGNEVALRPSVTRELLLRRFVEVWLAQQREAYERKKQGG
jgi:hypothetical protein